MSKEKKKSFEMTYFQPECPPLSYGAKVSSTVHVGMGRSREHTYAMLHQALTDSVMAK